MFHQYLVGRHFTIYSDHKPLQYLFIETCPVPPMASSRIQQWALMLSAYNYRIVLKSGDAQANDDAFSTLPLTKMCLHHIHVGNAQNRQLSGDHSQNKVMDG